MARTGLYDIAVRRHQVYGLLLEDLSAQAKMHGHIYVGLLPMGMLGNPVRSIEPDFISVCNPTNMMDFQMCISGGHVYNPLYDSTDVRVANHHIILEEGKRDDNRLRSMQVLNAYIEDKRSRSYTIGIADNEHKAWYQSADFEAVMSIQREETKAYLKRASYQDDKLNRQEIVPVRGTGIYSGTYGYVCKKALEGSNEFKLGFVKTIADGGSAYVLSQRNTVVGTMSIIANNAAKPGNIHITVDMCIEQVWFRIVNYLLLLCIVDQLLQ